MPLKDIPARYWRGFQPELFEALETELGPLGARYERLIQVFEFVLVEKFLWSGRIPGRPAKDRVALARAFLAKAVFDLPTTRDLIERLEVDSKLRRLCGWSSVRAVPSEATFSRAFAEFALRSLPGRLHEALIKRTLGDHLVGHISRDATAIEAREKPAPKLPETPKPKRKRGRPRKGEERPREPSRLERQRSMPLAGMLAELPQACNVGSKRNAKGHQVSWIGYKLHIDSADGGIPVSCILTSASMHDSQAAIPLAEMTAARVDNLYDLMDSAYDAVDIRAHSASLGHVPIIDNNPRRSAERKQELRREATARRAIGYQYPESRRYRERSTAERVNARLKDEFGGRHLRVRGHGKAYCHLMFGILALSVSQLLRLQI